MLRLLRARAWGAATVLCLAVSTIGVSFDALLHERDTHDACCVPSVGEHDAGPHGYQAAPLPAPHGADEHCLVCHWARSFRHRSPEGPLVVRLDDAGASHPAQTIGLALSPELAHLPARSPPSRS